MAAREKEAGASRAPGGVRGAVADFWVGLTVPTFWSWVATVLFAGVELYWACLLVTPRTLASLDPALLMETENDHDARLTIELLKYKLSKPSGMQVTFVAASQGERAFVTPDSEILSQVITRYAQRPVRFNLFTANRERFEHFLLIAEQLPPNYRGVFVMLTTDYGNTRRQVNHYTWDRLAVPAPLFESLRAQRDGKRTQTHNYFLDNLPFFAARRGALARLGPAHRYHVLDIMNDPDRLERAETEVERQASYRTYGDSPILNQSRVVIDHVIDYLKGRGVDVILLEAPSNPLREEALGDVLVDYREQLVDYANQRDVEYWDLNPELDLQPDDFQDWLHLGSAGGRSRFQHRFMKRLAEHVDYLDDLYHDSASSLPEAESP